MTTDQLREVHHAQPFEPFTLHLADGREFRVGHPEFLAMSPGGRTIYVVTGEASLERIDLLMVVSISTGSQNGRGRRKKAG